MIERLLPDQVVCVERFSDVAEPALFPAEAAVVASAVAKRQREFATVRHCARLALRRLGIPPAPILPGQRGAPQWPAGVLGSMTHCAGYRAAAVTRRGPLVTIGIDAEPHEPLPDGVDRLVLRPEEQQALAALAATDPHRHWGRLVFSAKESVYKAWYPLTGRWLDFQEASVTVDPAGGFHARLLVPGPMVDGERLSGFTGRWLISDGLLVTAISHTGSR